MLELRCWDLFAGAGGCSVGYARAGFTVRGFDKVHHPDYPFELTLADALTVLRMLPDVDPRVAPHLVSASPPCPRYSTITPKHRRELHPDYIAEVRELLQAWGGLYVIENVPGARRTMVDPIALCGSSFGLRVRRHRLFESNVPLWSLPCQHAAQGTPVGVYGDHPDSSGAVPRPNGTSRGVKATSITDAQHALGIDWMSDWDDLTDAIPPAMTEFVGEQIRDRILAVAA